MSIHRIKKTRTRLKLLLLSKRKTSRQGLTGVTAGTTQNGQTRTKNRNEHMQHEQK
jgi:hypothetical protein